MANLMIKSGRRYRLADKVEVLAAAAQYMVADVQGDCLSSPGPVRRLLQQTLGPRDSECFCALWLTTRNRLIALDELFQGTINAASVWPREVVKTALARNAAAVILAHCHPSGEPEPSPADEAITRRLQDALALIEVRVVDHCIATRNGVTSLAERGLL